MNGKNISKKIIYWYDNNKRFLPWRKKVSKKNREYYTLVSEFMLQQTQVKTVIPYFVNFIKKIPNINSLAKVNNEKLMKYWEGLGYYSRARNLKKTAIKILKEYNGRLPGTVEELKTLPGIGDYTSRAIMAIAFNKKIIPLDGNVERILKRVFYLKKEDEISKECLNNKIHFFGTSNRASDYAQAIMEVGALVCKPNNPLCVKCPISLNCISFKKNDFMVKTKNKFNKTKYFEAKIYQNNNKYLLVKNNKFNFLKNMPIFPMSEVEEKKYKYSNSKKINIKLSNMDMKIILNKIDKLPNIKNKILLNHANTKSVILPSFTKKIFSSVSNI
jgi:A/G-specific adenine glycosylase